MTHLEQLIAQATELPVADRIVLMDAIRDSLPEEEASQFDPEWLAEIQRRSAEYDAGKVKGIPWEEVLEDSLRRAGVKTPNASS